MTEQLSLTSSSGGWKQMGLNVCLPLVAGRAWKWPGFWVICMWTGHALHRITVVVKHYVCTTCLSQVCLTSIHSSLHLSSADFFWACLCERVKLSYSRWGSFTLFCGTYYSVQLVQPLSRVWLFATQCTAACQASLSITNSWSLLKLQWVSDAIQPSHPLSYPSPSAFNPSQHQGLFKWIRSLHQVAKVLEFQLQHQSFQWVFRTDFILTGLISLQSKGLSRVSSNTMVDGRVMVESSDKTWSTGEGNGKPLQYSCLEIPMNLLLLETELTVL